MLRINQPKTLYERCLNYVSGHFFKLLSFYTKYKVDLKTMFHGFPPVVCEELLVALANRVPSPTVISYLMRRGVLRVDLSFYPLQLPFSEMKNCLQAITYLDIYWSNLGKKQLRNLVRHLPNIISLNIGATYCTDVVIKQINKSCRLLEKLNLNGCLHISDMSMRFFCSDYGKTCSRLKVLNVNNTRITAAALVNLVERLPLLYVHTNNKTKARMVFLYCCRNPDRISPLRSISIQKSSQDPEITKIISCFPEIEKLNVKRATISENDILSLSTLRHLKCLSLTVDGMTDSNVFKNGLTEVLKVRGSLLQEMRLNNFTNVNLYTIGLYCPQIEILRLVHIRNLHFEPFQDKSSNCHALFGRLKDLFLDDPTLLPSRNNCLVKFLKHCISLELCDLSDLPNVSDEVMLDILPCLQSLRKLVFRGCRNSYMKTIEALMTGICPNFETVVFSTRSILLLNGRNDRENSFSLDDHWDYVDD